MGTLDIDEQFTGDNLVVNPITITPQVNEIARGIYLGFTSAPINAIAGMYTNKYKQKKNISDAFSIFVGRKFSVEAINNPTFAVQMKS